MASRARSRSAPGPLAILSFVGLIAGAIYLAGVVAKIDAKSKQEAEPTEEYKPFAELPREEDAFKKSKAAVDDGYKPFEGEKSTSPDDLMSEAVWKQALRLAETGYEFASQAVAASESGDMRGYREYGKKAEKAFDNAFTMTAEWEAELESKYGAQDSQVREIMRVRNKWIEKVRHFHKTAPPTGADG